MKMSNKINHMLEQIRDLKKGWDSYDADPISNGVMYCAERVVSILKNQNLNPDLILPMADGDTSWLQLDIQTNL
jgi:hypothetical protein